MATIYGGSGSNSLVGDNDGNFNDIIYGGGGSDTLRGLTADDILYGGTGSDLIDGGTGNDTLYGGSNDDSLIGGDGFDFASYLGVGASVTVNLGTNTATGEGSDTLSGIEGVIGGTSADTITGDTLGNNLQGEGGGDLISGAAGLDSLYGGAGLDVLYGGADADLLFGGIEADTLAGNDGIDTLYGEAGLDRLYGGNDADQLFGGGDGDLLWGDAGTDSLFGEAGIDTLYGGADADTLYGGNDGDLIFGNDGLDALFGDAGTDTLYGDAGNDILDGGSEADTVFGGTGLDTLYGGAGVDSLRGGDNDDLVYAGTENDNAFGDAGTDTIYGGAGADTLDGGDGSDFLLGEDGTDSLIGGNGDDTLRGGDGGDRFEGGTGLDFLDYSDSNAAVSVNLATGGFSGGFAVGDSGAGVDGILGSVFNDTLVGFDGSSTDPADAYTNVLYGGLGNDSIAGLDGGDSLFGGADDDTISGDGGNDTVDGGVGRDILAGGTGDDIISGGTGQDTIYGGAGTDRLFGGDDEDQFFFAFSDVVGAETIDGGLGGSDNDSQTIDITGFGWDRLDIAYDPLNAENGVITFFAADGVTVLGTLSFSDIENLVIVCFTLGTRILTDRGDVAVEVLRPGDLVQTRDHGLQPLRWVGQRQLSRRELIARPALQPIRIAPGALFGSGPATALLVSPQHRLLVEGAAAELYFAEDEVLVPAKHLVGLAGVTRECPEDGVTYVHVLFDRHEILLSNGAWTESFQPAERTIDALESAARAEVLELFPQLAADTAAFPSARVSLKAHEARILVAG